MPAETHVNIGAYAVSRSADAVLTSMGLGSCVGLALLDRTAGVAGLVHILLPDTPRTDSIVDVADRARFAPTAVPLLIDEMVAAGARRARLEAVIVGGASMFSFKGADSSLDIGGRNRDTVVSLLERAGIPLLGEATGGDRGRTIRVELSPLHVTAKATGSQPESLVGPLEPVRRAALPPITRSVA